MVIDLRDQPGADVHTVHVECGMAVMPVPAGGPAARHRRAQGGRTGAGQAQPPARAPCAPGTRCCAGSGSAGTLRRWTSAGRRAGRRRRQDLPGAPPARDEHQGAGAAPVPADGHARAARPRRRLVRDRGGASSSASSGRNGSGKSTLLKCMAGIYGIDSGEIRIDGRVVPFIELGVGFNMEMTAFDNVVINGVMMGMSPREARGALRRGDRVRRARATRSTSSSRTTRRACRCGWPSR